MRRAFAAFFSAEVAAQVVSAVAAAVASLTLGACASSAPSGESGAMKRADPATSQEVLDELRRYYDDFSARNWTRFADHFWPGATLSTIWQPPGEPAPRVVTITVPEFVAQAPSGPGSKPIFEEKMLGSELFLDGDLAQVWAQYAARFGDPGSVAEWRGIDAFTLLRHGGRWRIASLAYVGQ